MSIPVDGSPTREEGGASICLRSSSPPHCGMAAERLTDDLIVEILSRVPVKSLCRFKCVSNHWFSLIYHPDHRKKLPQTLAGFFHIFKRLCVPDEERLEPVLCFTSVSGRRCPPIHTSFAFLPNYRKVDLLDCCNGLLLCRWYATGGDECRYIVCNPAREEWVMLPEYSHAGKVGAVHLGFDPAVSSNFYVFVLLEDVHNVIAGVDVYSSETRRWVHKEKGWNENIKIFPLPGSAIVFLNGSLHFHACSSMLLVCLAAVDTKGETWTIFRLPSHPQYGFLQQSQGCLHYSYFQRKHGAVVGLVVYVLNDYRNKEWILKHTVQISHITGGTHRIAYRWIAIHPECDLIFLIGGRGTELFCYNMDRQQAKVICNTESHNPPFLPYVPLYAELQSLHS